MKTDGRGLFLALLVVLMTTSAFLAGGLAGWTLRGSSAWVQEAGPAAGARPTPLTHLAQEDVPEDLRDRFQIFWEVWALLEENFYDRSRVDYPNMVYGAIQGVVDSVDDPYTFFSTPAQTAVSRTHLQGEYEGIGAWIERQGSFPVILGPIHEDTPAARAGLRLGDVIIAVDGQDVEGMALEEVIGLIKGPAGTQVTLTIAREGETAPFEVTLVRAHIEVASVEGEMREDGLAYVHLNSFGDKTSQEFDTVVGRLLQNDPKGLILDLRGNGGGYLQAAREILGRLLPEGVATYQADRDDNRTPLLIIKGGLSLYDLPVVVLVNGASASASEIVAGALQDTGRAILVGEQTFGKGSIQNVFDLPDGSSVRITVAHWLTPKGRQIQDEGLTPDIIAPLTPEDYEAGLDPQLDAAAASLLGQPLPASAVTPTATPSSLSGAVPTEVPTP